MKANYKGELHKLVQQKKKLVPTNFSEAGLQHIFEILESTPRKLCSFAEYFDENSSQEPIIKGKRSFRNTLVHFYHGNLPDELEKQH